VPFPGFGAAAGDAGSSPDGAAGGFSFNLGE
jgi:hypothetical protein